MKQEKYFITDIELKGFKGTKAINNIDKDTFKYKITEDISKKEIILIYAENGTGKTTLLENLHPYPNMISRDIKKSIEYPAYKKIIFKNKNITIRCEIHWLSDTSTKGYIYIDNIKHPNTLKGNITEYIYTLKNYFIDFNKFKTSLFMQQDILEIVKAKPTERAKIINNFSNPTISYEDIKKASVNKLDIITSNIKIYEKEIENFKGYENRYNELKKINVTDLEEKLKEIETKQNKNLNKFQILQEEQTKYEYLKKEAAKKELKNKNTNKKIYEERINKDIEEKQQLQNNILKKDILTYSETINNHNENITSIKKMVSLIKELHNKNIDISKNIKNEIEQNININNQVLQNYSYIKYITEEYKKYKKEEQTIIEELNEENNKNLINRNLIDINQEEKKQTILIRDIELLKYKYNEQVFLIKEIEEIKKNKIEKKEYIELVQEKTKLESKNREIKEKENEKNKLENIIINISENEEDYICKCCHSKLNKKGIEKHLEDIKIYLLNNKYREITIIEEQIEKYKKNKNQLEEKEEKINQTKLIKDDEKKEKENQLITLQKKINDFKNENENILKIKNLKTKLKELKNTLKMKEEELSKYSIDILNKIKTVSKQKQEEEQEELIKLMDIIKLIKNPTSKLKKINLLIYLKEQEEDLAQTIFKKKELEKTVEKYEEQMKKINILEISITNNKNVLKQLEKEEKELIEVYQELKEFKDNKEEIFLLKKILEENKKNYEIIQQKLVTYNTDKEFIEKMMKDFLNIKEKIEELTKEEFIYKKIKNYSDRIKKAQISNFFSGITKTINEIIQQEEGTLSNLKVSITQKGNKNLNIETKTKNNKVEDIALLSGAEQSIVSKGISLALAKEHNFGIVYIDESDGKLSKENKEQFFRTLRKTEKIINTNQLFVISHNEDLLLLADKIIDFKKN